MQVKKTIVKAGRDYKATMNGATDVSIKYQIILDSPLGADELPTSFPGVPEIGDAHPTRSGFYALEYSINQPDGAAKNTLEVEVKYGPSDITTTGGGQEEEKIESVTEWGWDDGTGDKELVTSVEVDNDEAVPILNSAGDPFDSVPTVSVPTPTFTKVIRSSSRKSYADFLCTVNKEQLTIGDMVCAPGTLLCTVAEKKLIGEWRMPYEYTIHLRYRSNKVSDLYDGNTSEIGWDVAITDTGMRYLDDNETPPKLKLIQVISAETNQPATVNSPALLDGQGHKAVEKADGRATPVILHFHAYKRTVFPQWFYSEPPTPQKPGS